MKYVRNFLDVNSAIDDEDIISPNVTAVNDNGESVLLKLDCGDEVPLEIGKYPDILKIYKKYPMPAQNNQIYYRTALNTTPVVPNDNTLLGENNTALSIVSNEFDKELQCWIMSLSGDLITVGDNAFYKDCSFKYVALPNSVTTLKYGAFRLCSTTWCTFRFGNNIRTIEDQVFRADLLKNFIFPKGITSCGAAFKYCGFMNNKTHTLRIPGTLTNLGSVDNIPFYCCYGNGCENIIFEDGVESIIDAFAGTNEEYSDIKNVLLPTTLKTLGYRAFYKAFNLEKISIPSAEIIDKFVFHSTKIKHITLPTNLKTLNLQAFQTSNLEEFPTLPISVEIVGDWLCWKSNNMKKAIIPGFINTVTEGMFCECYSLSDVTIEDGITSIKSDAFADCPIEEIILPSTLSELGDYCFGTDPYDSKYIHVLKNVTCNAVTPPTITATTFNEQPLEHIYVPAESVTAYKEATNWATYADIIEAIPE